MEQKKYSVNINKHAILIRKNGQSVFEDRTGEVRSYSMVYGNGKPHFEITYRSGKTYPHSRDNVEVFNSIKKIDTSKKVPYVDGKEWFDVDVYNFSKFVRFIFKNGRYKTMLMSQVKWFDIANKEVEVANYLNYLQNISKILEGDSKILQEQLKDLEIPKDSVLYQIINNKVESNKKTYIQDLILPFSFNKSQREAVRNALNSSISLIQGPPGTGKTQTILNIISNLVYREKTVAVVAGNNEATINVKEKLEKENLDFITAYLGKLDNINAFFEQEKTLPQEVDQWRSKDINTKGLEKELQILSQNMSELDLSIETSKLKQQIDDIVREQAVFNDQLLVQENKISKKLLCKADKFAMEKLLSLKSELEILPDNKFKGIFNKMHFMKRYGIFNTTKHFAGKEDIILHLTSKYYKKKLDQLKLWLSVKEKLLQEIKTNRIQEKIIALSMQLLQNKVAKEHTQKLELDKSNFRQNFKEFQQRYPVVFSTTHALVKTSGKHYLYDYVIVDESSQVDLCSAAVALSCAKNVVLVGDLMQLPNVVPTKNKNMLSVIFNQYNLDSHLDYQNNSILSSVEMQYKGKIPNTLLNEHYRCDPEIIGFCNKRFYDNKLIVQTKHKEGNGVHVIYTESYHARVHPEGGQFNERQVDITEKEILPLIRNKEKVGIVTPFRRQVAEFNNRFNKAYFVDTIHKFQGKEKENIVFSTVVNKVHLYDSGETDFLNNPNLLNVAISRPKDKLFLLVSEELMKQEGVILSDFARYIKYYTTDGQIQKTSVYSVMDLMHSEYSPFLEILKKQMRKNSKFDSENIVEAVIKQICVEKRFGMLGFHQNYSLRFVVDISTIADLEDRKFAANSNTHCDFLLFNTLDKSVQLVIEVDGVQHIEKTQKIRDERKDRILKNAGIPIIRIRTTSSSVKERIEETLDREMQSKLYSTAL